MELIFELNGSNAATPRNANEIKLISNWNERDDNSEADISTNTLEFILEDAKKINNHIAKGLTGGVGIFEGLPYRIKVKTNQGTVQEIFDGYIDLTSNSNFISCDEVQADVKKRKNLDWLTTNADGISFGYLSSLPSGTAGAIGNSDYVNVPYILNFVPDEVVVTTTLIALFLVTKSLGESENQIKKAGADVTEALDLLPGTNTGDIAAAILAFVLAVIYLLLTIIAIIGLILDLLEQLYPAERVHRGIKYVTMFEKSCEFLGLNFQSTIFQNSDYKDLVLLPNKNEKGYKLASNNSNSEKGTPTAQSGIYNVGDFFRVMKDTFNAKIKIQGKTLVFEREDYWDKKSVWTLPNVETDQDLRLSTFKYNTDEIASNLLLSFQTDATDENTLEYFKGTNYQVITEPNAIVNKDFVNIKGLSEVRLPFARGKQKTNYTAVELILKPIIAITRLMVIVVDGFTGLNTSANFPLVSTRKGKLNLSGHTTSIDKMLILDTSTGKLKRELTAKELFDNFHISSIFYNPATGEHNQKKVYEGVKIPFCLEDWNKLLSNNKFNTVNGKIGEVNRVEWDINTDSAILDYTIKELYTKNIKFTTNEGQ